MGRTSSIRLILLLVVSGLHSLSYAATLQDARIQYHAGKLNTALKQTNALLNASPENIPALFLKAQIQSEGQYFDDAIETYNNLISLDSGHLQAYNNLAALYAQQGQLVLASETLEQAIRTDPVYNTIHLNLRAIYLDMSKKHYRQALKLKPEDQATQIASINLANRIHQTLSKTQRVVPQSIPAAGHSTLASHAAAAESTPAAANREPELNPSSEKTPQDGVKKHLLAWANAWSDRDAERYVNAYVDTYAGAEKTHQDWAAERGWILQKRKYIKVTLSNIRIQAEGDLYRASFRQNYESDNYRDEANKEMIFKRQGDAWKILTESTK